MKIAVPVAQQRLCPHFGHCQSFALFDVAPEQGTINAREDLVPPPHEPGVLPRWLHSQGAQVILAGGMGARAQQLFARAGVDVVVGAPPEDPVDVVASFLAGDLRQGRNLCDH